MSNHHVQTNHIQTNHIQTNHIQTNHIRTNHTRAHGTCAGAARAVVVSAGGRRCGACVLERPAPAASSCACSRSMSLPVLLGGILLYVLQTST